MKRYTLTKEQLTLLSTVGLFGLLEYFTEPCTPSEVAKQIARPANVIHYKAKQLEKAGLLQIVEQRGRNKKYQVVSREFRFHKKLLPIFARQFPEGLDQHLKKV
jgi:predicted transcriptional regulator